MTNQGEFDYKYFINLALQNKIAWNALPFIIEGLAQTFEKSKEVIKFLLQELEKSHVKIQSLEGHSKSSEKAKKDIDTFISCEVAKLKSVEKMVRKSVISVEEPRYTSENESPLIYDEISILKSETNEVQTTKEIPQEVKNFDHEMFAFESDLNIKTEFKIESVEGMEYKEIKMNSNLRTKKKVDKELKSFKCEDCGKAFKRPSALGSHKRTHGDFECKFCGKKFMIKGNLSTHERVHVFHEYHNSKQKPFFECGFCNGLFTSSQSLDSHLKLKHKE